MYDEFDDKLDDRVEGVHGRRRRCGFFPRRFFRRRRRLF